MDFESDFEVPYSDDASRLAKQERSSMKRKLPKRSGIAALVLLAGAKQLPTPARFRQRNPSPVRRRRL